jgi:folate-binding Fe-S cluster repair protein YgfZ
MLPLLFLNRGACVPYKKINLNKQSRSFADKKYSQISTLVSENGRKSFYVEGADAKKFLHGLMTNDLQNTKQNQAIYCSFLNPQGRVLFDAFCFCEAEDKIMVQVCSSVTEEALKHLQKYKLRSKVQFNTNPEMVSLAICGKDAQEFSNKMKQSIPEAIVFPDPRNLNLGFQVCLPKKCIFNISELTNFF